MMVALMTVAFECLDLKAMHASIVIRTQTLDCYVLATTGANNLGSKFEPTYKIWVLPVATKSPLYN